MTTTPKLIHRIWLGSPLPDHLAAFQAEWERLHPQWVHILWTEENLPVLENQRLYDDAERITSGNPWQLRADIARYEILRACGGVYIDTDLEALKPIDPLCDVTEGCWFAWEEQDRWIGNTIIGAQPNHPFIAHLIAGLPWSAKKHRGEAPTRISGPQYVTRRFADAKPDDVRIHPQATCYPYGHREIRRFRPDGKAARRWPDAYMAHHWQNQRTRRKVAM